MKTTSSRSIYSHNDLLRVNGPSSSNGPLSVQFNYFWLFCLYDSISGTLVSNPGPTETLHFVNEQITNLTGVAIPGPSNPSTDSSLPGCGIGDEPNLVSADCILAKTLNAMPAGCDSNPYTKECILHLFPAFCIDLYSVRMGLDAESEVEYCLRRIALGPCVANPSGAACRSGLFPGIAFVGDGGGHSPGRRAIGIRDNNGPLFGPGSSDIPAEDSFWIGKYNSTIQRV